MICDTRQVSIRMQMHRLAVCPIITDMRHQARTYPHRVAELRHAADLSLDALAERLGCNRQTLHAVEIGRTQLTLEWMHRLARALGVTSAELLHDYDRPYTLSRDELALLQAVRALPPERRELAPNMIMALAS
jgi:transcriptional regulator with XRE-family HTH domain